MSNLLYPSVLPVLRHLPVEHPRKPLLPGLKRRPLSFWPLLFFVFAACALPFLWLRLFEISQPNAARLQATGRVTQVEPISGSAGGQTTFVKYRFVAGQNLIYGSALIEGQRSLGIGDTLPISYDPKRPSDNYQAPINPFPDLSRLEKISFALAATALLVGFFGLVCLQNSRVSPRDYFEWRRTRKLYRNGELAPGRVQFVRSTAHGAAFEIVATYKVEGVRHVAVARCDNAWLINLLTPETEVVVAHDPLKPERSVILEPFAF